MLSGRSPPLIGRLLTRCLRCQAALDLALLRIDAQSRLQEAGQSGLSRITVRGVGGLLELNSVKEPL